MNLDVSYQEFLRLCEKTRDSLGLQYELPFMSHISWSDISKRDISDPDIPTGEELLVKEKDDQSQEWIYSDFEINTCKNLLDFGSGPGTCMDDSGNSFLKTLCENYYSLDDDPQANCNFKNFNDIPKDLKFDAIIAHHCLEHVDRLNINSVMFNLCSLLEKNGIILIVVPNIYNWLSYVFNIDHVLPLTLDSIGAFLYMNDVEPFKSYLAAKSFNEYCFIRNSALDSRKAEIMEVLSGIYKIHPASQLIVAGIKR